MAFPYFSLTQAYATIISFLNSQMQALSTLCKNQTTGDFTDQVRYNSSTKKLESWTGSTWIELDISGATIALATAATSATTAVNATTHISDATGGVHGAVSVNTGNMIVRRDASGNFNAGTITATLSGNATTSTNATTHAGVVDGSAHGAAVANTGNMIVRRDISGNFSAGTITASLAGNATSATTSASCSGTAAIATALTNFTSDPTRGSNTDFSQTVKTQGIYSIAAAGTNGPGPSYLNLIHCCNSTDVAFQIAGGYTSDNMYFRGTSGLSTGTGWTAWRTVIHSGNIATQTVATAGTCTGNAATATTAGTCSGNSATATNASQLNGQAAAYYATAAQVTQAAPPGAVIGFAMSSAPSGWLICSGAAVSRATYAALFAAIGTAWGAGDGSTTFNLPELRGEFVRGLDSGRGIDSGRAIGTAQAGYVEAHTHTTYDSVGGMTTGGGAYPYNTSGAFTKASGSYGTGTETRPRNQALLFCIKF